MWSPTLIDPAVSDQLPNVTELIDTAKAAGVRVIAVSAGLPYDLPFMNRADALLAVYSQIGLPSVSDGFRPAGAYGPNLPAAMEIIFGVKNPSGKLPVDIPALSGNTFSTEKIYTRGEGLAW
jgi:beta-N-acetylhexosaminidase